MADFYEASRALYAAIISPDKHFRLPLPDAEKIASLRALIAQLDKVQLALEAAVTDLQNGGQTNQALSHAYLIATFDYTATQQLLVLALDSQQPIIAAAQAMDDLTGKLDSIAKSTAELVKTVDKVTQVLELVGSVTKLATA